MKRQRAIATGLIVVGLGFTAGEAMAQLRPKTSNPFMRQKLDYATGVLEGVTLGKYDLVITNALPLRDLSMTNVFLLLANPAYGRAITNFQAAVDGLVSAAQEKDQARTTEGYTAMVRSCVQCHAQFRREQAVSPVK